jgi:hypothetical protein
MVTFTFGTLALAQCRWCNCSQCRSRKGAFALHHLSVRNKSGIHPKWNSQGLEHGTAWQSCQWMSRLGGYCHWESEGWCSLLTSTSVSSLRIEVALNGSEMLSIFCLNAQNSAKYLRLFNLFSLQSPAVEDFMVYYCKVYDKSNVNPGLINHCLLYN